jgi:uroporphyrinogen-III synthase
MGQTLAGRRIGVTSARRSGELIDLLARRGAEVVHAPAIAYATAETDPALREATERVIACGLDDLVVTTATGFSAWLAAAEKWDVGDALRARLAGCAVYTRGAKARGAIRAAGLREAFSPAGETDEELLAHLSSLPLPGRRVALQSHGEALPAFVSALSERGATVTELLPYRCERPADTGPLLELIEQVGGGCVDAVTFTSAPAARTLLGIAAECGRSDALRTAFRAGVLAACVGEVTAAPLRALGIGVAVPARARTAALVRAVERELATRP